MVYECAVFEGGIRLICEELLEDGIVDPQRLLHWLEEKTKRKPYNEFWFIKDERFVKDKTN